MALGRAYQHLGQLDAASTTYFVALDLARDAGQSREYKLTVGINLAKLLSEKHHVSEALDLIDAIAPDYPEFQDTLTGIKVDLLQQSGVKCPVIRLLQLPCAS